MSEAVERLFAPPGDAVRLASDLPWVFELAGRLWEERAASDPLLPDAIGIEIKGSKSTGEKTGDFFEENQRWVHGPEEFRCEVPGVLAVTIGLTAARIRADVSPALFHSKKFSSLLSFLARTLLEAPVAVLLARRGWQVLHAGAVVGPRGAVVVRGASGAGKSTLVAAAHAAGLGVLGDESLLVSREHPDELAASVRDLAVREDAARLLGLEGTEPAFTGREAKRRVDLFAGAGPRDRSALRVAAVLLGPREPGPARLLRLGPDAFCDAFRAGEIPQERPGDPEAIARAWAGRAAFRLTGASDLAGAVRLLKDLVG